ncbi:site-specific DNA-methyltransferase (adenine-specific)/adenine-specific DNA-methyltransferase [Nitrosospira briensis]|uniref:Site-specific DNA-methyltransferase (Adenine-specific)/adenine-specific DNA-methyltransferase n=1 Tax=Nitrosospira briensis TaxID=35799 RepID=A0A1I5E149_9PROT|nr:site-specific DNA-methyltransferase [Nitrosospira briensis]SFO05113.1 site-specific DNA-methyltransferase (adenine-specific)/adenine-specific DNA-methyltransferase [Nitrosospira briensis]
MTKTTAPLHESLQLATPDRGTTTIEKYEFEPIKGYPMLNWRGKRPFASTQYYPAQLKEIHGEEVDGWRNKIFWGDNLQVMSHLLKNFRGKIDLIYIDPPFDSKADFKRKISLMGKAGTAEHSSFEDKQYSDIWTNDEYLQFMYERVTLLRELLSPTGSIFLHCDDTKNFLLRALLSEVFGEDNFRNEIIWKRSTATGLASRRCGTLHDTIYWYSKTSDYYFKMQYHAHEADYLKRARKDENGRQYIPIPTGNPGPRPNLYYDYKGYFPHSNGYKWTREKMEEYDRMGRLIFPESTDGRIQFKQYLDEVEGVKLQDLWLDVYPVNPVAKERNGYPTQKPESLLDRIISMATEPSGLVFDCFMGSGTTQASAMKTGRRFIGADINLGAIQTTSKRLTSIADELRQKSFDEEAKIFSGFELYNVNHYDVFRNPIQARDLLIEALEVQKLEFSTVFDGEKDGRMVKIMPVNRITTRADLNELIAGFDYKAWERRQNENPNRPVEKVSLVCMGHELDLAAQLVLAAKPFKIDVEVVDILRDKSDLEFKRDSQAKVSIKKGELVIEKFYPMNLLQKLSLQKESVEDWKELAESVLIDWNYDGAVLQPALVDIPGKDDLVKGVYKVPDDAGTIRVKITDLLSESWEGSVANGN